jgi:p-cymene methyl-monooxygenase electron transfer component
MANFLRSLFSPKAARRVEVRPFGASFEVPAGQTLLESALANAVPLPHNCTVGTCGACKCRLTSGRVKAITDFGYALSERELAAGYILACQAVPQDERTVIEVEASGIDAPPAELHRGRIVATERLTHDILRIRIELDRPLRFVAGQYANLKTADLALPRCYSFADAPEREGSRTVSFMVRKVPGGAFTEALFAGRLDGEPLTVEAPLGDFHLRTSAGPMICVAGGSGLAPLLSILEDARKKRVTRRCVVLFGARTQADLYAIEQLRDIGNGWRGGFEFVPVLSNEPADSDWSGRRGMVTEYLDDALRSDDPNGAELYMCGPPPMIDRAIDVACGLGVGLEAIHYDKFTDLGTAARAVAA